MAHVTQKGRRQGLRLFGHPVHPMLTAFPIGLWATSLLWDLLGIALANATWWAVGFWSVAAGLAMALLVATTGFVDYVGLPAGDPAEAVATRHLIIMLTATTAFLGSLLAQGGPGAPVGLRLVITVALAVLGTAFLVFGGWLGGELVFRLGVGSDRADVAQADARPADNGARADEVHSVGYRISAKRSSTSERILPSPGERE